MLLGTTLGEWSALFFHHLEQVKLTLAAGSSCCCRSSWKLMSKRWHQAGRRASCGAARPEPRPSASCSQRHLNRLLKAMISTVMHLLRWPKKAGPRSGAACAAAAVNQYVAGVIGGVYRHPQRRVRAMRLKRAMARAGPSGHAVEGHARARAANKPLSVCPDTSTG